MMKFSNKLFLTIFFTSTFSVIVACVSMYNILTFHRKQEFEKTYMDHIEMMGVALHRIETSGGKEPTKILEDLVALDDDNKEVELLTPASHELRKDGAYWNGHILTLLVTSKAGRLRATISAESHEKEVLRLKNLFAVLALALGIFSLVISKILTKILLKKIHSIQTVVMNITNQQDYTQRIPVLAKSNEDEIEQLSSSFNTMFEAMHNNQQNLLASTKDKAQAEIAAQVAHDIRSPLTSISLVIGDIEKQFHSESVSLLKNAVSRISGIVQKLSQNKVNKESAQVETPKLTLLYPLIANVVNEYQVRLHPTQSLEFLCPNKNIWCVLQVNEMQTALANLIHNSFEASATKVHIAISEQNKIVKIKVADNGSGIPSEMLTKIFERHFTHGKAQGSGLGLDQVKNALQWNGGKISVESSLQKGSTFTVDLPIEKEPSFVARSFNADKQQKIYFVDDDSSILQTWKIKTQNLPNETLFFDNLESFGKETLAEKSLVIIDNNLGGSKKGIDIIKTLKLDITAFLCTSDYDNPEIQDQMKKLKAKLIPKPLLTEFEIGNS